MKIITGDSNLCREYIKEVQGGQLQGTIPRKAIYRELKQLDLVLHTLAITPLKSIGGAE